jgi:hypothetical protein
LFNIFLASLTFLFLSKSQAISVEEVEITQATPSNLISFITPFLISKYKFRLSMQLGVSL